MAFVGDFLSPRELQISRRRSNHTGSLSRNCGWEPQLRSHCRTEESSSGLCRACTLSRTTIPGQLPSLRSIRTRNHGKTVVIILYGALVRRCCASCRLIRVLWPFYVFYVHYNKVSIQYHLPVLTATDAVAQPDVDPAGQLLVDQPQR